MALLTVAIYRRLHPDDLNTDGDIEAELADAQLLADQETRRSLESAERTEQVRVDRNGHAFPAATPVTAVATDGWTIAPDGGGYLIGSPIWPRVDVLTDQPTGTAEITYTGGYTTTTAPKRLLRAIAEIVYDTLNPPDRSTAGVKSASVGDVSVAYDRPARRADGLPATAMRALRPFRRRL